jgi:hypothetical protein
VPLYDIHPPHPSHSSPSFWSRLQVFPTVSSKTRTQPHPRSSDPRTLSTAPPDPRAYSRSIVNLQRRWRTGRDIRRVGARDVRCGVVGCGRCASRIVCGETGWPGCRIGGSCRCARNRTRVKEMGKERGVGRRTRRGELEWGFEVCY